MLKIFYWFNRYLEKNDFRYEDHRSSETKKHKRRKFPGKKGRDPFRMDKEYK
ncbi:hypothetical protein LEP1GSC188_0082 [Leptospira weilii serovar Topaz str. LT2116]|uniref:Uncharacterized protein n=1 Tax=Leptospira weilii serovar Topaz str. LT2116 TaxID=1088540 RepID=M3ESZ1_9LEPT|nr:hypothetical protein LEP1GSC188_0082 [Leptospira weilii serovar Topaz str. LT2116]